MPRPSDGFNSASAGRLDGRDLFPVEEREEWLLGCRVYATQEGLRGSPTQEMLRASLAGRNLVPGVS